MTANLLAAMPSPLGSKNLLLALNKKKLPTEVLDPTEEELSLEGSLAATTDPTLLKNNNFYQTPKEESRYVKGRLIMLAAELDMNTSLRDNLKNWLGATFNENMAKHASRKQQQAALLKELEENHREELRAIRKELEGTGTPATEPDGSIAPPTDQVADAAPSNIEITLNYSTKAAPIKRSFVPPSISVSV